MHQVEPANALVYLREQHWIGPDERAFVRALTGGVSNEVLYVERPDRPGQDFVLKQARAQLRVAMPWFSAIDRIWREVDFLETCGDILVRSPVVEGSVTAGVPRVLHTDRVNFAFAMSAAPSDHVVWRKELLAGRADKPWARLAGRLLGTLHAESWRDEALMARFADRQIFDELRLDPYYRTVAKRYPEHVTSLTALVDSVWEHHLCLVHADYSPKNMLLHAGGMMLVDFETGHFGDPAFDLGFFLAHLVLKATLHAPRHEEFLTLADEFWSQYEALVAPRAVHNDYAALVRRGCQNLAGCLLARIDGKSPVDYLNDPPRQALIREVAIQWLTDPPVAWATVRQALDEKLRTIQPHQVARRSSVAGSAPADQIVRIRAVVVLDSRGEPTVEVEITTHAGAVGRAIVPSGASTGRAEAVALRDGEAGRYDGKGVRRAVENVERVLAREVLGLRASEQAALDAHLCELDGTPNKSRLGANAILGISLAAAHAAAATNGLGLYRHVRALYQAVPAPLDMSPLPRHPTLPPAGRLPLPMTNMISGGLHAGGNLDFQDFLIMPHAAPSYAVGLEWIVRVYRRLGMVLSSRGYEGRLVGDEGGYGPRLPSNAMAAELIVEAIEKSGLRPGEDVSLAIDVAASHFFDGQSYRLAATGNQRLSSAQMIDELAGLVGTWPITSIEDGLAEEDWPGWQALTARLGGQVRLVGDDLFATNPVRIRRGIEERVANSVLIKVNQIGTLSETLAAMRLAQAAGYSCVVSARSGETEDTTIADLAVGTGADLIKIGSVVRSERLAKYNCLLWIARELEDG